MTPFVCGHSGLERYMPKHLFLTAVYLLASDAVHQKLGRQSPWLTEEKKDTGVEGNSDKQRPSTKITILSILILYQR